MEAEKNNKQEQAIVIDDKETLDVSDLKMRINKLDRYIGKMDIRLNYHQKCLEREFQLSEEKKNLIKKGMNILNISQSNSRAV
jgi:hypothetical protein